MKKLKPRRPVLDDETTLQPPVPPVPVIVPTLPVRPAGEISPVAPSPLNVPLSPTRAAALNLPSELPNDAMYPQPLHPVENTVNALANQDAARIDAFNATNMQPTAPTVVVEKPKVLSPLEQTRAKIAERQNKKYNDKWGILDTLKGAGLGFLKGYAATGSLGGGLGGAAFGAVQGTIQPSMDERWSNENHLAKLYGIEKQQEDQETQVAKQKLLEAQTQTIFNDDAFSKERLRVETERKNSEATEKGRQAFIKRIFGNKRFDPSTASEFDKAEGEKYGIDINSIGKFDFSNPVFKQVGDSTYKFNRDTGSFEETNLPKDAAKTLVDFEVKMPGEERPRTFRVSEEKAAGFATQMRAAGIQAELAEKRLAQQDSQFKQRYKLDVAKFTQAKKEFDTQIQLRQQAMQEAREARARGDERAAQAAEDRAKTFDATLIRLREATLNGNLDEEQQNDLIRRIDELGVK